MEKEDQKNFELRKKLAEEKGLIKGEDYSIYRHTLDIYKLGFSYLLNKIVNFKEIDKKIEKANLYFSYSKTAISTFDRPNLESKYYYCLNQFYIEKLTKENIYILKNKESIDEEVLKIITGTYQDVITKQDAKMITYGFATPERIIENGSLVLEFVFGKNSKELSKEEFIENMNKQTSFIESLNKEIIDRIANTLNIKVKILIEKAV